MHEGARGEDARADETEPEGAGVELRGGGVARSRADERREGEAVGAEGVSTGEDVAEEREGEAGEGGSGESSDEGVVEKERWNLQ